MGQQRNKRFQRRIANFAIARTIFTGAVLLIAFHLSATAAELSPFHIPGTTQTYSGYDTSIGTDAICWVTHGGINATYENQLIPFPNKLVRDFNVNGSVQILVECPTGNNLAVVAQPDKLHPNDPLRTGTLYNYTISATLNLTSLNGTTFVADNGAIVAVQVVVCELGKVGFCTPFVHEEANAALAAIGKTQSPPYGSMHGDTHIHSKYYFISVPTEDGPLFNFTVTVPLLVNTAASYFVVAAVQMFLGNTTDYANVRYDMANAPTTTARLVTYQDPAIVLEVPGWVHDVSYVAISVGAAGIVFLLFQTVKHRNHQVLQLCQGSFLIIFLGAALIATLSSFLLAPANDLYCRVSLPLVMCSIQLLYAITVGRLWRINAVISPLLVQTLRQQEGCSHGLMIQLRKVTMCMRRETSGQTKKLRKRITNKQLARVVATFSLPQVILQVLSVTLQPLSREIVYNADKSVGHPVCSCGSAKLSTTIAFYGYVCFILLVFILLFMAQATRNLPSLFNETSVIFDSTVVSLIILVLGAGILAVTASPTTSPAVQYLVEVAVVLSITLQTSYRIMIPKLRMIWNGETVVVSKLVSDHKATVTKSNAIYQRRTSSGVSDFSVVDPVSDFQAFASRRHVHDTPTVVTYAETGSDPKDELDVEVATQRCLNNPTPSLQREIAQPDAAPTRRLILKMVTLQEQLTQMNRRIMSGLVVREEEWATLRFMSHQMGTEFFDEVKITGKTTDKIGAPSQLDGSGREREILADGVIHERLIRPLPREGGGGVIDTEGYSKRYNLPRSRHYSNSVIVEKTITEVDSESDSSPIKNTNKPVVQYDAKLDKGDIRARIFLSRFEL